MIIAVDFDGTCVTHAFPKIGQNIGAELVLKALTDMGHKLILYTMRSDVEAPISDDPDIVCKKGNYLTDAINWFKKYDIPLWGINENPEQKSWTGSPKPYANLYIDDSALGCPKTQYGFVYWLAVANLLWDDFDIEISQDIKDRLYRMRINETRMDNGKIIDFSIEY